VIPERIIFVSRGITVQNCIQASTGNGSGPLEIRGARFGTTALREDLGLRHKKRVTKVCRKLIPVAARSKAWVCGRSLAGIVDSNLDGGMNDCLL